MSVFGPIGFAAPWLLLGLAALPILWLILRAVPPAPIRRRFPGVALLLGLKDETTEADRTPWWLLLLRMFAVAAVIVGFAGPVLNPRQAGGGAGPILLLADGTWADARDWERRQERMDEVLAEAGRAGRTAAVVLLTDLPQGGPVFVAADEAGRRVAGLTPRAWEPGDKTVADFAAALAGQRFDTVWLSDGLARGSREGLTAALAAAGAVTVYESPREVLGLRPAAFADGAVKATVLRSRSGAALPAEVGVFGPDPAGTLRELARARVDFAPGAAQAEAVFDLPAELRNRIARVEIAGQRSAGAVALADDSLRRRKIALIDGGGTREGLELLSPTHYLHQALAPTSDLIDGTLGDILLADPDVIVMTDVARIAEADKVLDWVEKGGLLVRFAGPRLAASDVGREVEDPLLPVRLRAGGREVGGAMSWGEPKELAPFAEGSPFQGLEIPPDVTVAAQVMAEPGPDLAGRVIAALTDGTPLVTMRATGEGRVILFHVTANAEWSTLPLSGLFVAMLERLAVSAGDVRPETGDLAGSVWVAERVLDARGVLGDAGEMAGVPGERLAEGMAGGIAGGIAGGRTGPDLPPGLYRSGDRRIAVNAVAADRDLAAPAWPAGVTVEGVVLEREMPLKGWCLAAGLAALLADILAALWLAGRLSRVRAGIAAALVGAFLFPLAAPPARAGDDTRLIEVAGNVILGHVVSGDAQVDRMAEAGMLGLSEVLYLRTSVEPGPPVAVDPETDELSVFTFLYWPVTAGQKAPSPGAYAKLNRYLRSGGMILFDTRDGDLAGFGGATPEGRRLQALAAPLDIPPLEPMPPDHVLTRSFYLIQDFPGRHTGRAIWVEAAPPDAEKAEGMPFRNLNDGVTPVVIGGNDWASAWAVDQRGLPLVPVGRGMAGERQREIAYRFGVNLIMHVLTGNYKSDQVHVPALLERLGQ
ncbi:MAG: DUF4159 domain-containing protein [Paracoccaceae bacterium]